MDVDVAPHCFIISLLFFGWTCWCIDKDTTDSTFSIGMNPIHHIYETGFLLVRFRKLLLPFRFLPIRQTLLKPPLGKILGQHAQQSRGAVDYSPGEGGDHPFGTEESFHGHFVGECVHLRLGRNRIGGRRGRSRSSGIVTQYPRRDSDDITGCPFRKHGREGIGKRRSGAHVHQGRFGNLVMVEDGDDVSTCRGNMQFFTSVAIFIICVFTVTIFRGR
mmetsp:Transcript_11644/g.24884  ORF Transcript_11644/g.24884 Transcript_11644/m.24884 type:complete len:218 (-) Transcript_11644:363-1016(-)